MAYIIETINALDPLNGLKKHTHPGGISVRGWLENRFPGFEEFPVPTICLFNGEPLMRKDWTRVIGAKDIVNFVAVVGDPITIIALVVVAVVAAVSLFYALDAPVTPGETPASDPVFSVAGQNNTIRLGEPIEVCYGRNHIYPSLASRPFFQYVDNEQFQFSLFCLGHGYFDIEAIQIGDTDITNYQEVDYEVIEPGGTVTLFPTNVYTSVEAGGQELFAPNQEEYTGDGWVGPFPSNPSTTETTRIEVDVVLPKGLYRITGDGKLRGLSITIQVEAREIDDFGDPVGAGTWVPLSFSPYVLTIKSTTPQRRTLSANVSSGRYEVRMRRTSNKRLGHRAGNDILWEGMRGYIDVGQNWGDITLLAVKIRASNNLNERTQLKFNVIATRKLPIYDESSGWSAPQTTRSIVWAWADVFRSLYGGRIFDDGYLDLGTLIELDAIYESRNEHFDWIFRDPITVWDAARAVARVGRAAPLLVGSLITMKRDAPLDIPVALFSPDNITQGSFQWDIKLWDPDEFDSVSVEYTDPTTGYKQEQVLAVLPGGTSDHPQDLRLIGVQDRNHAYREGLYLLAAQRYVRENITFDTGLEGHIPTFGDLIMVAHDVPRWGQSGYVVKAEEVVPESWQLWVSEPLTFESGDHQILLRGKNGSVIGPLDCFSTADPMQVRISMPEDSESTAFDFLTGGDSEPMLFLFGVANEITEYLKVVRIEPQGGERIRITAAPYRDILFSFDELTAPPLTSLPAPPVPPDLPTISRLYVTQVDGTLQIVQISWTAAFGAQYYIVQTSTDGETWQDRGSVTKTAVQVQVRPGDLWVRVAAVNVGQGPWIEMQIVVGLINGLDNHIPWAALEWGVRWWEVLNATGYSVKVYDASASALVLKRTSTLAIGDPREFVYGYAEALADSNVVRNMMVEVDVVIEDEDTGGTALSGSPTTLDLFNSIPTAPTNLDYTLLAVESDVIRYRLSWDVPAEGDLIQIKVWFHPSTGFDPAVETPFLDETISAPGFAGIPVEVDVEVPLDSFGGAPAYYWRVALFDVWGNELTTNLTAEQEIPAGVPS